MNVIAMDGVGARVPLTSFVGRREEIARLRGLMAESRLVTITGAGGSGKTRLAEELVAGLARSLKGGAAFARLAGISDPSEVTTVVAAAVDLRGGGDAMAALIEYLRERRFVLVLDNCEHVTDGAARLASQILERCPAVAILATSRRALLVPGEQLFPIEGLTESAAVTLFAERVRLVSPSFVLAESRRPLAVTLCDRLDGMPLAIELAAARMRHLGLGELVERLSGHLTDLGSTSGVAPERQRTLRGAIGWSHDLLDEPQRALWRRLAVFVGTFSLGAAETVTADERLDRGIVERVLGELVDRSMVVFDPSHDRYRMIEAMREFGLEQLRGAGEDDEVAARHRSWMLDRATDFDRRWWGPDQAALLDEMSADAADLRAALESCRATGAHAEGLQIAMGSLWYWMTRASHAEAARWFVPFLEHEADPALAARAHAAAGWIAVLSGRLAEAGAFLDRAANHAARAAQPAIDAYVRMVTGYLAIAEQRPEQARALARVILADPAADDTCRSWALLELGIVAFMGGNLTDCQRACREGIELSRGVGESWARVPHLHLLAGSLWQGGEPRAAMEHLVEALRIDRRLDDLWHRAWSIEAMAWVSVDLGLHERAARLLGIAAECWAFTGAGMTPPWQRFHDTTETALRRRLGTRYAREVAIGRQLDQVRAMSFALEDAEAELPVPVATVRISPREREVAALVAQGLGNREIGERLFLSPRTVETHVQHLLNKLGLGTRAEIAAWHAREVIAPPVRE